MIKIMENRCIYIASTTLGILKRVLGTYGRREAGLGIRG